MDIRKSSRWRVSDNPPYVADAIECHRPEFRLVQETRVPGPECTLVSRIHVALQHRVDEHLNGHADLPVTCLESRGRGEVPAGAVPGHAHPAEDRKSTRLNSSHSQISYAVFCLKKK